VAAGGDAVEELVSHVVSSVAPGDVPGTLEEFLTYSERKRMGMHLGQEKGTLIEVAVREGLPSSGPAVVGNGVSRWRRNTLRCISSSGAAWEHHREHRGQPAVALFC